MLGLSGSLSLQVHAERKLLLGFDFDLSLPRFVTVPAHLDFVFTWTESLGPGGGTSEHALRASLGSFALGLAVASAPYLHPRLWGEVLGAFLHLDKPSKIKG